jgi:hypothetical protein
MDLVIFGVSTLVAFFIAM